MFYMFYIMIEKENCQQKTELHLKIQYLRPSRAFLGCALQIIHKATVR